MVLKKPERKQPLEIGEQALVSDGGRVNAAKVHNFGRARPIVPTFFITISSAGNL
ncbi:hypothetical protein [Brevundimonas sp. FT23028]|uniref:hypothetical protein n=1 Tax=Brevundimonas sp. FT23028 TaxID=3393748 RepID=UPI003B58876E